MMQIYDNKINHQRNIGIIFNEIKKIIHENLMFAFKNNTIALIFMCLVGIVF